MAVVSFWEQIFGVVIGVIDLSTDGRYGTTEVVQMSSFAKGVQATASTQTAPTQTARLSDDKLVQSAIKVCKALVFLNFLY